MMKISALCLVLFLSAPIFAQTQTTDKSFQTEASRATLAIFKGKQVCEWKKEPTLFGMLQYWDCTFKSRFTCTASVVRQLSDGSYYGLTAGHCIRWDEDDGLEYYVSDKVIEHPVLRKIKIIKSENDDRYDYCLFSFDSYRDYPVIDIDHNTKTPEIGTRVLNINFSRGVAKQIVQGVVTSDQVGDLESDDSSLRRRFFVILPVGPGASGSPVIDLESHKIVGLVEDAVSGTPTAILAIPTGSNFLDFMDDDTAGIRPLPEGPKPEEEKVIVVVHQATKWETFKDRFMKLIRCLFWFI